MVFKLILGCSKNTSRGVYQIVSLVKMKILEGSPSKKKHVYLRKKNFMMCEGKAKIITSKATYLLTTVENLLRFFSFMEFPLIQKLLNTPLKDNCFR